MAIAQALGKEAEHAFELVSRTRKSHVQEAPMAKLPVGDEGIGVAQDGDVVWEPVRRAEPVDVRLGGRRITGVRAEHMFEPASCTRKPCVKEPTRAGLPVGDHGVGVAEDGDVVRVPVHRVKLINVGHGGRGTVESPEGVGQRAPRRWAFFIYTARGSSCSRQCFHEAMKYTKFQAVHVLGFVRVPRSQPQLQLQLRLGGEKAGITPVWVSEDAGRVTICGDLALVASTLDMHISAFLMLIPIVLAWVNGLMTPLQS